MRLGVAKDSLSMSKVSSILLNVTHPPPTNIKFMGGKTTYIYETAPYMYIYGSINC